MVEKNMYNNCNKLLNIIIIIPFNIHCTTYTEIKVISKIDNNDQTAI